MKKNLLPKYLEPHIRTINGQIPSAFPSKKTEYSLFIDFSDRYNGTSGLYIDEEKETGLHHFGGHQDRFWGGSIYHATAYDNDGESLRGQMDFESWVTKSIYELYNRKIHSVIDELSQEPSREKVLSFLEEMHGLVSDPKMKEQNSYPLIEILNTIFDAHTTQSYTRESISNIMDFVLSCDKKYSTIQHSGQELQSFAFSFLPKPYPSEIVDYFYDKNSKLLTVMKELNDEEFLVNLGHLAASYIRTPPIARKAFQELFFEASTTSELALHIAQELISVPEEALLYIQKGLEITPNHSALLNLKLFVYVSQGLEKEAHEIRVQLQKNAPILNNLFLQESRKEYKQLYKDFRYYDFFKQKEEKANRIIELEHQICDYWMEIIKKVPSQYAKNLQIAHQNKGFDCSGSAIMMRRCVDQELYDLCVQKMKLIVSNVDRCRLQYDASASDFEELMTQGLKAMLDSQKEEFLIIASELIPIIDNLIPEVESDGLIYNFACIMARNNHCEEAISYTAIALKKGIPWNHVKKDHDLSNIHQHPDFLRLAPK